MNNSMTGSRRCRHGALSPGSASPACRRCAGFTLIELLVVMLVIVILAGILFKAGRALQERAKVQQAKADVARLASALERYYADHGRYPFINPADPTGIGLHDFEVAASFMPVGGEQLWLYLDEDCTYRRDRRSYISGWPKDRLGTTPVRAPGAGPPPPIGTVLRYYKDPWGKPYQYTIQSGRNVESRGGYLVKSNGPNGSSPTQSNQIDDDDIWAGTGWGEKGIQVGR